MPEKILVARTSWDFATANAFHFLGGLARAFRLRGFEVIELVNASFNRSNVEANLMRMPRAFIECSHGNETIFTGHLNEYVIISCVNDDLLRDKITHALSCLTAQTLGRTAVQKGCKAYIGYAVSFTWINVSRDVIKDKYAWGFMYSDIVMGNMPLVCGGTAKEAYDNIINSFNKYIEWWSKQNDPYASEVISWMIYDRDGLRLIGDGNAKATDILPKIPYSTDIITPDKAGKFRVRVIVLSSLTKVPMAGVPVKINGVEYTTDDNGVAEALVDMSDVTIEIPTISMWEDGTMEKVKTISWTPNTNACDIVLVAYAPYAIIQAAGLTQTFITAAFMLVLYDILRSIIETVRGES